MPRKINITKVIEKYFDSSKGVKKSSRDAITACIYEIAFHADIPLSEAYSCLQGYVDDNKYKTHRTTILMKSIDEFSSIISLCYSEFKCYVKAYFLEEKLCEHKKSGRSLLRKSYKLLHEMENVKNIESDVPVSYHEYLDFLSDLSKFEGIEANETFFNMSIV